MNPLIDNANSITSTLKEHRQKFGSTRRVSPEEQAALEELVSALYLGVGQKIGRYWISYAA